jgi:hypothetical protein
LKRRTIKPPLYSMHTIEFNAICFLLTSFAPVIFTSCI